AFQVGANANQTITATSSNFSTNAYGNYRIGGTAATTTGGVGDLTLGSTANAIVAQGKVGSSNIAAGTLTVNGAYGSQAIPYAAGASAKDLAALVNAQTEKTGVNATARTEVGLSGLTAGSSYTLKLASDNGTGQAVTISFTVSALNNDGLGDAAKAFNDASAKTGVTARVNDTGTGLILTNASGNDIHLLNDSVAANTINVTDAAGGALVGGAGAAIAGQAGAGAFGTNDLVVTGQLTLDSSKSFSAVDAGGAAAGGGFLNVATSAASQMQTVQNMDVSTVDGANRTLAIVDAALSAISGQRASYGALQSRFETTVNNLQSTSENMSASRSRIQDADFAAETANLSRAQILQQAGTAMVAQANQLPQGVLALLRG
ncbi:MAG: flagellin, partial [Acidovorax sp.]|nr:flagellin [Acidovorax sp.]